MCNIVLFYLKFVSSSRMNTRVSALCLILIGCVVAVTPPLTQIANQFKRDKLSPLITKGFGADPNAFTPCQTDVSALDVFYNRNAINRDH